MGGFNYFMVIIDKKTRWGEFAAIWKKSELGIIKSWKSARELESVKIVRTDWAVELTLKVVKDFFASCGIQHETSIAHEHHQDRMAQRFISNDHVYGTDDAPWFKISFVSLDGSS